MNFCSHRTHTFPARAQPIKYEPYFVSTPSPQDVNRKWFMPLYIDKIDKQLERWHNADLRNWNMRIRHHKSVDETIPVQTIGFVQVWPHICCFLQLVLLQYNTQYRHATKWWLLACLYSILHRTWRTFEHVVDASQSSTMHHVYLCEGAQITNQNVLRSLRKAGTETIWCNYIRYLSVSVTSLIYSSVSHMNDSLLQYCRYSLASHANLQ